MSTLRRYVLGELLKSFSLAALALTALFTLAGGLVSVARFEGLTTGNITLVLPLLLPIVITLTMPIAALFAATMVYGRLAQDNELLACRAAGINIHRLFVPAFTLALGVSLVTLVCANFVIPDFLKRIEDFARLNLRDIAFQQLRTKGAINVRNEYFLAADDVQDIREQELREKNFPTGAGLGYIWLSSPTFLQVDQAGRARMFVAADGGLAQFDTRDPEVKVTIYVSRGRVWEVGKSAGFVDSQRIGPVIVPRGKPPKPAMVDLRSLLEWREAPWSAARIAPMVTSFQEALRHATFFEEFARRVSTGETVELQDADGVNYEITAAGASATDSGARASRVRIVERRAGLQQPKIWTAPEADVHAAPSREGESLATIHLLSAAGEPVRVNDPLAQRTDVMHKSKDEVIDDLLLPQSVYAAAAEYTPRRLIDPATSVLLGAAPLGEALSKSRTKLIEEAGVERRKVESVLHFRSSFASAALVTVIMGAALGVIFRGGQALAAFGLAMLPLGAVTLAILMGRQIAEKAGGEQIGVAIIWGGLALIGVCDLLILRLGVRR